MLIENWDDRPGGTGQSFNIYDRVRKQWHQTWVDSKGGLHEYWGGLEDGNMCSSAPCRCRRPRDSRAGAPFSLHAYRNQLRLRASLERLHEPGVDLIDIALDLGFSSHSHFTETFRRSFGKTPSVVRETL